MRRNAFDFGMVALVALGLAGGGCVEGAGGTEGNVCPQGSAATAEGCGALPPVNVDLGRVVGRGERVDPNTGAPGLQISTEAGAADVVAEVVFDLALAEDGQIWVAAAPAEGSAAPGLDDGGTGLKRPEGAGLRALALDAAGPERMAAVGIAGPDVVGWMGILDGEGQVVEQWEDAPAQATSWLVDVVAGGQEPVLAVGYREYAVEGRPLQPVRRGMMARWEPGTGAQVAELGGGFQSASLRAVARAGGQVVMVGSVREADAPGQLRGWVVSGGGELVLGPGRLSSVTALSDGGFVAAGETGELGADDIWLVHIGHDGELTRSDTLNLGGDDSAHHIAATADGDLLLTGGSNGLTGDPDPAGWVIQLSPSARLIGGRRYRPDGSPSALLAVLPLPDGTFIAGGLTVHNTLGPAGWLVHGPTW